MQFHTRRRAIIIGAGIAGITTALAFQHVGIDVAVFERAEELREVGSGLPLWSNALRAFHTLGLTNVVESLGQSVIGGGVTTWQGERVIDVNTEELLERLGTINIVFHRAELLSALLTVLGTQNVFLGMTYVGCTQDETGVIASFADGTVVRGDLLVGADGLHSCVRSHIAMATKPRYAGYTCWRGIAQTTGTDIETWAWGKGAQFGIAPMSKGRAYWFAQRSALEGQAETSLLRNDVYEGPLLSHWSRDRVTLLGDAAHTMTPNLGQGACVAIEDAVTLAECLKTETNVTTGLRVYEKRRVNRANTIARLAGFIGQAVQLEKPLAASLRDAVLKKIPPRVLLQQLTWILEYQA